MIAVQNHAVLLARGAARDDRASSEHASWAPGSWHAGASAFAACAFAFCLALLQAACSIDHCKVGTTGCYGGAPRSDGSCDKGLVAQNGRCIREEDAVNQGDAGGTGQLRDGGFVFCDAWGVCQNACEQPATLPRSGQAVPHYGCGGETLDGMEIEATFASACKGECLLLCQHREWFCGVACNPETCNAASVQNACHRRCDAKDDPLACIQAACADAKGRGCSTSDTELCAGGKFPNCEELSCNNTCTSAAFDGVCDDGDTFTAHSAACAWGTDCADCGPRRGEDTTRDLALGSLCAFHEQCAGFNGSDFGMNLALCAPTGLEGVTRCLPDCSSEKEICAPGSGCTELSNEAGRAPLQDPQSIKARACVPLSCQ